MTVYTLDNRALEAPEPMVGIFDALKILQPGDELQTRMDREPILIDAELERRGFTWEFDVAEGPLFIVRRLA